MKDDEEDVSAGAGLLTVQCSAVWCSAAYKVESSSSSIDCGCDSDKERKAMKI